MAQTKILITDYGVDSGYGRVTASIDSGHAYEDIKEGSFDSVGNALRWVKANYKTPFLSGGEIQEKVDELLRGKS